MAKEAKAARVYRVFQHISHNYDGANLRISLGMERRWKKELVQTICQRAAKASAVLDVCCGTGDISLALSKARPDLKVTGLDFSPAMLEVAKKKGTSFPQVSWQEGDALHLPFADNQFAAACISFGLRNTSDYLRVLQEMTRVVKPGGWVYCLDSFVPESALVRPFYALYFRYLMPLLGGGLRYLPEYNWLWQSTRGFLKKDELRKLFQKAGLEKTSQKSHLFGACVLHAGEKIKR